MKHIPIFFSIDDNYAKYLSVTIESIIENRVNDYILDFYILNTGLNSNTVLTLERMVKASNDNIYFVDMKEALYMLEGSLFTRDYYSKTTYYRLFIPRLFPNIDKGIYLDGDIVLTDDIINLYDIELSNKLVGVVTDEAVQNNHIFIDYVREALGIKYSKRYFNAGVLLMNLEGLRKFNFENKFINLLNQYKFVVAQDQDYLNVILKGHTKMIDFSFNIMPINESVVFHSKIQLIHYNLSTKPWKGKCLYDEYFWDYASRTPYYNDLLKIRDSYKVEDLEKDIEQGKHLINLCLEEIDNPNNYSRIKDSINLNKINFSSYSNKNTRTYRKN